MFLLFCFIHREGVFLEKSSFYSFYDLALSVRYGEIEDLVNIPDNNLLESSPCLQRFYTETEALDPLLGSDGDIGDVAEGGFYDGNHCYGWPLAKWHARV